MSQQELTRPQIGINAVLFKRINGVEHILLGKRKGKVGSGFYYFPGGHIEKGETIEQALIREVQEECGVDVTVGRLLWIEDAMSTNHIGLNYEVTLLDPTSEIKTMEPHKHESWEFFPIDNLPEPLWHHTKQFLEEYKNKTRIERFGKPAVDFVGTGVGAVILNENNEILFLKRGKKAKNEVGKWKLPGGTIEWGETMEQTLIREMKEEVGVEVEIEDHLFTYDDFIPDEGQHWIAIFFVCRIKKETVKNMEPGKIDGIEWFGIHEIPENVAIGTEEMVEKMREYLKIDRESLVKRNGK